MEKLTGIVALISSLVTIGLTVYNANLSSSIQLTEIQLKQIETELKRKAQDLEVLKEKTSRYEFVNKLLPDLMAKDRTQVILKTNLVSLALSEEEARRLFDGFKSSRDKNVQEIGSLGTEGLVAQREKVRTAELHEAAAFEALIGGDYPKAIAEFEAADHAYPTFHQAYEIARLLRQNKEVMGESTAKKTVLKRIVSDLSWGASPTNVKRLNELAK